MIDGKSGANNSCVTLLKMRRVRLAQSIVCPKQDFGESTSSVRIMVEILVKKMSRRERV
jgi:hypothetical protein